VVTTVALVAGGLWWQARSDARVSAVRELLTAAAESLDEDPQRSLLLALEANERGGPEEVTSREVQEALHAAIAANRMVGFLPEVGYALAVSPSTGQLVTLRDDPGANGDWSIDLWDPATGDVVLTLPGHEGPGPVWDAEFSADGSLLASGDRAGSLHVWDAGTGELLTTVDGPNPLVDPSSISPDNRLVAANWAAEQYDGRVRVVRLRDGMVETEIEPLQMVVEDSETASAQSVEVTPFGAWFSPDGSHLAVSFPSAPGARDAHAVQILDTREWEEVLRIPFDATEAAWSPDGSRLALTGWGGSRVVDAGTGEVVHDLPGGNQDDGWLTWNDDGTLLASGSGLVWSLDEDDEPVQLSGRGVGQWATFAGTGDTLFTSDFTDVAILAVPGPGSEVARLPADGWQSGLDYAPDGASLAVSAGDGDVAIWDTSTWSIDDVVEIHADAASTTTTGTTQGWIPYLDWSPDGRFIATAGEFDIAVVDAATKTVRFRVDHGGNGWQPVDFSPDSTHLAFAHDDPTGVAIVGLDGERVSWLPLSEGLTESLRFSPDGGVLAQAVIPGTGAARSQVTGVKIWDWQQETLVETIETSAAAVSWSPAGDQMAISGIGLGVWDVGERDWSARLSDDGVTVQQAVFSPDGQRLASCEHGAEWAAGHVRVWDVAAGAEVMGLTQDNTGFCRVRFSPDGRHVAVSDGGFVRIWTLDEGELVEIAQSRVLRSWTTKECQEYLHLDACPA
jgi:WD40 repeat protein